MAREPSSTASVRWDVQRFAGNTFAFAGELSDWEREHVRKLIQGDGGQLVEEITPTLDFLVLTRPKRLTEPARKLAIRLNKTGGAQIQILESEAFYDLFHPDVELAKALLRAGTAGCERLRLLRWLIQKPLDLRGLDLRGIQVRIRRMSFRGLDLDGADLRGADLSGAEIERICDARMDMAILRDCECQGLLVGCNLQGADLSEAKLQGTSLERSDLTGANLKGMNGYRLGAAGTCFRSANLQKAYLLEAQLAGADFTGACLHQAQPSRAKLADAKLQGADLREADLTQSNLQGADLTDADLRGASLVEADLRRARIDGANFEGANVAGANLAGLDTSRARGLQEALSAGGASGSGPHLQQLDQLAVQTFRLRIAFYLELPKGNRFQCECVSTSKGKSLYNRSNTSPFYQSQAATVAGVLCDWRRRWPDAQLDPKSITGRADGVALTAGQLRKLVDAAWDEVSAS